MTRALSSSSGWTRAALGDPVTVIGWFQVAVLGGMGLLALHSAHWAKPFVRLMQDRAKANPKIKVDQLDVSSVNAPSGVSTRYATGISTARSAGVVSSRSAAPVCERVG